MHIRAENLDLILENPHAAVGMFRYDRIKEEERRAKGEDHCQSDGEVFELGSLVVDGVIHDPRARTRLLEAGRRASRVLIFAVNADFQINVGFDGRRGSPHTVKHETLFQNAEVRAAGELEVKDGMIVEVTDISGTYGTPGRLQTDPSFSDAVLIGLDRIGARLDEKERQRLMHLGSQ